MHTTTLPDPLVEFIIKFVVVVVVVVVVILLLLLLLLLLYMFFPDLILLLEFSECSLARVLYLEFLFSHHHIPAKLLNSSGMSKYFKILCNNDLK